MSFDVITISSMKPEARSGMATPAESEWLGHNHVTTSERYVNLKADYLHELNDRKPLTLVRG
jgi:hypothetical protein